MSEELKLNDLLDWIKTNNPRAMLVVFYVDDTLRVGFGGEVSPDDIVRMGAAASETTYGWWVQVLNDLAKVEEEARRK